MCSVQWRPQMHRLRNEAFLGAQFAAALEFFAKFQTETLPKFD